MGTQVCHTHSYAATTGTSVLRKHLIDHHRDEWISACMRMKIKITAQQAQPVLDNYRAKFGDQHQAELNGGSGPAGRKPFSNEAFLDAICDWVVADDQVGHNLYILIAFSEIYTLLKGYQCHRVY